MVRSRLRAPSQRVFPAPIEAHNFNWESFIGPSRTGWTDVTVNHGMVGSNPTGSANFYISQRWLCQCVSKTLLSEFESQEGCQLLRLAVDGVGLWLVRDSN